MNNKKPTYTFNATKVLNRLKLIAKQLTCNHSHTFVYQLENARREYGKPHGSMSCKTPGLVLVGCYVCGNVTVKDTGA